MTLQALKEMGSRVRKDQDQVANLIDHETQNIKDRSNLTWSEAERIEQLETLLELLGETTDLIARTQ